MIGGKNVRRPQEGRTSAAEVNMDCQSIPVSGDISGGRQLPPLIESLLEVLRTEIELQQELQRFLVEERRFLQRPDADRLLRNNKSKEQLLLKAMTLEEVMSAILKSISRLSVLPGHRITLSALSSLAPPTLRTELQMCQSQLTPLVAKNRELNEENRDVLETLLHLVNNSMRIITNLMTADSDYLGTGEHSPARMAGAVVCLKG
jgi:hypothetical protein